MDHETLNAWLCSPQTATQAGQEALDLSATTESMTDVERLYKMNSAGDFWRQPPPQMPIKAPDSPPSQPSAPPALSPSLQHQLLGQIPQHLQQQPCTQSPTPGGSGTPDTKPTTEKLVNEFQVSTPTSPYTTSHPQNSKYHPGNPA